MKTKTKTKTNSSKKKITKLIGERTSLATQMSATDAETKFDKIFNKSEFSYITYEFTKEDLPLLEHMASDKVNCPKQNRDKSPNNIARLLRCIKAGEWYFESNDVVINTKGILQNGQHTLDAIHRHLIDAKTSDTASVKVGFKLGSNVNAMPYLDTQKKRSALQNLTIRHNGIDLALDKLQKEIVVHETRRLINGVAFGSQGDINHFEYMKTIKSNKSILNNVFANRTFSTDFPKKAIGYALFCIAKVDEELAIGIVDEMIAFRNQDNLPKSKYSPSNKEEHPLVELFRHEKMCKMNSLSSKSTKDCYRSEEFYTKAQDWFLENYDLDSSIFKA
jgi:hypothetical protein